MDLSHVLAALDALVIERLPDGHFERRGDLPAWCGLLRHCDRFHTGIVVEEVFPFLEAFLPRAETAWTAGDGQKVGSEFWTETGTAGEKLHLEATAIRAGDACILVVSRNERSFHEQQLMLQRARELRLTYDALMREIEHKDILLHTIVHDLTAPLHSIMGALSLVREAELPASVVRWIEIASDAAARQRELVRDILDVFAAEHGPPAGEPEGVELHAAIGRALAERSPVARQRGVELEGPPRTASWVAAEGPRLVRVLTNLLDNAIRFSPEGGTVRIAVRDAPDGAVVAVEDDGPGVDPALLPRLFQKLSRSTGTLGGTGLGLYFCRITLERWGGGIGYEPRRGGGARFWIRVPRARATATDGEVTHGEAAAPR